MKKLLILAVSAAMMFSMMACSGDKGPDFKVQDAMDAMLAEAAIDDPLTLSEGDMLDFFGIPAEDMEEFAAITCANGISAQEIVLVKAADEKSAGLVETKLHERLENRKSEAENYLPDQYAILSECKVQRDGAYVALIVHPEHEALEAIYQGYLTEK